MEMTNQSVNVPPVRYKTSNAQQATDLLHGMLVERFEAGQPVAASFLSRYIEERFPNLTIEDNERVADFLCEELADALA